MLLTAVKNAMKNLNLSAEQAMNVLGIEDDEKEKLLKLMDQSR